MIDGFEYRARVRPFWCLRQALLITTVATCLTVPIRLSAEERLDPPPPDPKIVALEKAYEKVDHELETKVDLSPEDRFELAKTIVDESIGKNFDPLFVMAVIEVESGWNIDAVSPTGARGLMQLLPSTIREEARLIGFQHLQMFDPIHNVKLGISYLARLGKMFRHPDSLLLAYNQGPGGAIAITRGELESPEGTAYPGHVWSRYRALLKKHGTDHRQMKKLCRNPNGSLLKE